MSARILVEAIKRLGPGLRHLGVDAPVVIKLPMDDVLRVQRAIADEFLPAIPEPDVHRQGHDWFEVYGIRFVSE